MVASTAMHVITMRANFADGTRKPTGALFFAIDSALQNWDASPANSIRAKKWSTILAQTDA